MARLLITGSQRANGPDFDGTLFDAVRSCDAEQLLKLLDSHGHLVDVPNLAKSGKLPLHRAVCKGRTELVEALVRANPATIDAPSGPAWTPMHFAAQRGDVETINLLLRLGSQATSMRTRYQGETPLHLAAGGCHLAAVEALLQGGSPVDLYDFDNWTPIHTAAMYGHCSVIELLVRAGSQALDAASTHHRYTPMHFAAESGRARTIETLVRLGSRAIDASVKRGLRPLHYAALNGHGEALETLLRLGSTALESQDDDGTTPLQHAAEQSHDGCVRLLLAVGATPTSTLEQPVEEEEAAELRFRIYFALPLTSRLLFCLNGAGVAPQHKLTAQSS